MSTLRAAAEPGTSPPAPRLPEPADEGRPATVSSDDLLRGRRIVEISHNGEVYRLQATRLGKLILTK